MSSSCVLRRPSRCAHPDILTNNFIDALFLAVCVWFLIVAQLRWTHVIIAHFMTHLSNARPWSRPWHWHRHRHSECPLFGGDFLHHAASDSWTSVLLLFLFYLPLQSSADETVTRHLFGRDISTPGCHFAFAELGMDLEKLSELFGSSTFNSASSRWCYELSKSISCETRWKLYAF